MRSDEELDTVTLTIGLAWLAAAVFFIALGFVIGRLSG